MILAKAPELRSLKNNDGDQNSCETFLKESLKLENFETNEIFSSNNLTTLYLMENLKNFSIHFDSYRFEIIEIVLRKFVNMDIGILFFESSNGIVADFGENGLSRKVTNLCFETNFSCSANLGDVIQLKKGNIMLTLLTISEISSSETIFFD